MSQDTLLNLPRPLIYRDPPRTGMRVLGVNVCKVLRTVSKGGCFTPICPWSCSAKLPRHIYQPQHARASKHLNLGNSDKGQVSYVNGTSGSMFFPEATSSTLLIRSYIYYGFRKHHATLLSQSHKECARWGTPAKPVWHEDSAIKEASDAYW